MAIVFLNRVESAYIGYDANHRGTLSCIKSAEYSDSDPFVLQGIPGSNTTIYWNIKPIVWELKIVCLDVTSFEACIHSTDVSVTAGSQYAVDPTTQKRTKIEYFKINTKDHAGNAVVYSVTNARVKDISIGELTGVDGESPLTVIFYCDKVAKD